MRYKRNEGLSMFGHSRISPLKMPALPAKFASLGGSDNWLITWDDFGIDVISNTSQHAREFTESAIYDIIEYSDINEILDRVKYLAKRSENNYEIWMFTADRAITSDIIQNMFILDFEIAKKIVRTTGMNLSY